MISYRATTLYIAIIMMMAITVIKTTLYIKLH